MVLRLINHNWVQILSKIREYLTSTIKLAPKLDGVKAAPVTEILRLSTKLYDVNYPKYHKIYT